MIAKPGAVNPLAFVGGTKKKEQSVVMTMTETDTLELFSMLSFVVATDSQVQVQNLDERTERYEKNKLAHENPDGFSRASTQTLNNAQKHQNVAAVPTPLQDNGCQALSFEINDATAVVNKSDFAAVHVGSEEAHEDPAGLTIGVRQFVTDSVNMAMVTPGCLLDTSNLSRPVASSDKDNKQRKSKKDQSSAGTSYVAGSNSVAPSASGTNVGATGSISAANNTSGAHTSGVHTGPDGEAPQEPVNPSTEMSAPRSAAEVDGATMLFQKRADAILSSSNLLKRLQLVERAAQQNAFHRKQLDYRDLPDVKPLALTSEKDRQKQDDKGAGGLGRSFAISAAPIAAEPVAALANEASTQEENDASDKSTKKLFTYFNADLVRGRSVTAMVWHKINQDLLAVGYGKIDAFVDRNKAGEAVDEELQGGLVLFWSLRNPEYPEKVLRTSSPVTSMEFSRLSPMLLAVGLQSGDVNIYDVKREGALWNVPIESSVTVGAGLGHVDAVWQVKWVPRGADRVETLVSISSDGRVLQWSIKKGISVACLMRLARSGQSDGWISRQASGLCFDFSPVDPTTYYVGTEEGTLHKCSVSYSEQYLETYIPHSGPVYKVKCSPRWPQLFLTCSADWTIGLYHANVKQRPIFQMRASGEDFAVTDVCWCPDNSTVFAAVTQNGILQIWDLSVSCLDPVVAYDTNADDVVSKKRPATSAADDDALALPGRNIGTASMPPAAPLGRALGSAPAEVPEMKESRIQRLVRNLEEGSQAKPRRVLTSVAFCERAPAVVVGDSNGALTVYRVIDPVIITHMGPVQQTEKIKAAVTALDPSVAALLLSVDAKDKGE